MLRTFLALIFASVGLLLIAPLAVLGLPIWAVAGLSKLTHRLLIAVKARVTPWEQLIEYAPKFGWKPKANMSTLAYADKPFFVTTDKDGWRGTAKLVDSDIVVFGDSYAFGYGVNDAAYFADLNPDIKIKSIGVNGYNMVQSLLWMRQLAPHLSEKMVIWFVYHGNDLYENLKPNLGKYTMPFVRNKAGLDAWEVVTDHVSEDEWGGDRDRDYYSALAQICTPTTALSRRAFAASEYLIRKANEICDGAGARLLVMSIPDITQFSDAHMDRLLAVAPDPTYFDPTLPDTRLGAICDQLGITCIRVGDYLRVEDHKEHDAHWNERGHRRIAELIAELHRSGGTSIASAA